MRVASACADASGCVRSLHTSRLIRSLNPSAEGRVQIRPDGSHSGVLEGNRPPEAGP